MSEESYTPEQVAAITSHVDIDAPPPGPSAHVIFGTNQSIPATIVAERYHRGLAPLVIATGGVNRHNGIVEGREFHRLLIESGVRETAVRFEDRSKDTWQNVEFALPFLQEAVKSGLPITIVSKWYHLRAVHVLRTIMPEVIAFYAISWEPIYSGEPITRANWMSHPEGRQKVLREWEEVRRRVADGSLKDASRVGGAWR
jgi:uncharacterized SAM-binding protein YcdF (DUF218 family)